LDTTRPLYILPFDHRESFEKGLFGWTGALTQDQADRISQAKQVIYGAFKLALTKGAPKEHAGILVDAQFGPAILRDARENGYITCMPAERAARLNSSPSMASNTPRKSRRSIRSS
jgi:myo-inositol catabolism protein IolC